MMRVALILVMTLVLTQLAVVAVVVYYERKISLDPMRLI